MKEEKPREPIGEVAGNPSVLRRLDTWTQLSRLTYRVPAHGRSLFYTFGGVVFSGFLLMIATGFILAQLYNPIPQQAYQSLERIQQIGWASYIRALHYWTAQGIIVALIFHIARVFITGAYKHPRQVTWWLGLALFGTMLMGSYFSGTVLKWDEEGVDALNHYRESLRYLGPLGAALSGSFPGSGPMNFRLYVSHIAVFPVVLVILMVAHFYLVRIFNLSPTPWDRWSNTPGIPPEEMKGRFDEHARSIAIFSLVYYGFLAVIAFFVPAPLGGPPAAEHGPLKPPWPFLWVYGFENVWGVVAVIIANLILFGLLALVPFLDRKQERSMSARKGILAFGAVIAFSLTGLTLHGWFTPPQEHLHEHGEGEGHEMGEEGAHEHPEEKGMNGSEGEAPHQDDHPHDDPPKAGAAAPTVEKKAGPGKKKPHTHPPGTPDHLD